MKALICAFNTKYVHSALAPWCLKAGVREYAKDCDCKIFESTINEDFDIILGKILKYDFDLVALDRTDEGKSDSLVAACRLDDDGVLFENSGAFGVFDHVERRTGLDRSSYVEGFEFDEYFRRAGLDHPAQAHKRRMADGI